MPVATEPYRSPERVSRMLLGLLALVVAVDIVAVPLRGRPSASDAVDGVWGLVVLATIIVYLVWFRRMYRNLPALGARQLRWSPGWAVGAWFVPILNLWRPVQIARDISRASDPAAPDDLGPDWHHRDADDAITIWWILLLGSNLVWARVSEYTLGEQASDVLEAAAAVACAVVVWRLTQRHTQRARRLGLKTA